MIKKRYENIATTHRHPMLKVYAKISELQELKKNLNEMDGGIFDQDPRDGYVLRYQGDYSESSAGADYVREGDCTLTEDGRLMVLTLRETKARRVQTYRLDPQDGSVELEYAGCSELAQEVPPVASNTLNLKVKPTDTNSRDFFEKMNSELTSFLTSAEELHEIDGKEGDLDPTPGSVKYKYGNGVGFLLAEGDTLEWTFENDNGERSTYRFEPPTGEQSDLLGRSVHSLEIIGPTETRSTWNATDKTFTQATTYLDIEKLGLQLASRIK